jgi:general secretion pathway protein G
MEETTPRRLGIEDTDGVVVRADLRSGQMGELEEARSHMERWIPGPLPWIRSNRGLTLIELLIVMAVIGILSSIALLLYYDFSYQAQIAKAVADIATLDSEISTFEMMNERLPNDLAEIGRATLRDPWGNPYEYLNFALGGGQPRKDHALHPINTEFDLYSKGRDGDSRTPLTAQASRDDIIRANDGQYIGLASGY